MTPYAGTERENMEATKPRPFAELLLQYRTVASLTQEELAERAGLSSRGIRLLERGSRQPYRDTVRRLADALVLTEEERARFVAAGSRLSRDARGVHAAAALLSPVERQTALDSWIYVAYAQGDRAVVDQLRADLRRHDITTWVDEQDLLPGTLSWEQALRDAIRAATALLLIASPHTRTSRYIADELRIAELYRRPVYPIWIDGEQWMECVPLGWGGLQYVDARGSRYDVASPTLVAALRQTPALPDPAPIAMPVLPAAGEPRNPYKGLRPFTGADAGDFFGREDLVASLIATLHSAPSNAPRVLALVGASGSGKSSALLAGLLPRLQAGAIPGSEAWIYLAPMNPGTHPLEMLARTMNPLLPGSAPEAIRSQIESSPDALDRLAARAVVQPEQRVVLVVDQCEELFSPAVDEQERRCCVDALVTAAIASGGTVLLLLTLRADFYDRPLRYPSLGALVHAHSVVVLPPTVEDVRRAIERPAALPDVGLSFDEDLVGDLLFDLRGQVGALPLLQFTLDQLFARRQERRLTGAAYRVLGGLRGALARHAEATYGALADDAQWRLARALFLRLIDPGLTEQDTTRRRAAMTELVLPDPAETKRLRAVVDAFIVARLLVATRDHTMLEGDTDTTVEVSHEALIGEWGRLGAWLREARDDIRRQQAISADAAAWVRHDRSADLLYRGSLLQEAEQWAARNTPSAREVAFLATARAEHERQQAEERDRQDRQLALTLDALAANRRAANRLRALVGVLALFLVVAAALSGVAVRGTLQALQAQRSAEAAARAATAARATLNEHDLALSAGLATQATRQVAMHYDLGLLLSVQAARTAETLTTRSALLSALLAQPHPATFLYARPGGVRALAYSPDGRILASGGADRAIQVWNVMNGREIGPPLTGHSGAVTSLAFSPDGTLLASGSADQTVRLWHKGGTNGRWTPFGAPLTGQQDQVRVVAFSPNGKLLASSSWDGSIWLWDLSGPRPRGAPLTTLAGDIGALAFSPDGMTLAAGGQDITTIQLWDVAHRRSLGAPLVGQHGTVEQLAFSPDGTLLASTGDNGTVRLWDVRRRRVLGASLATGISPTSTLAFSHDGRMLALVGSDRTTLWDVASRRPIGAPLSAHDGDVYSVAFSPDGAMLATGDAGQEVDLWNAGAGADPENPLATPLDNPDPITSVASSPDGALLAAGDEAGHVRLWDPTRRKALGVLASRRAGRIIAVAFDPHGPLLAAADSDGSIQLWDVAHRLPLGAPLDARAAGLTSMAMSPDGAILAAGYADATIRLWDVARRRQRGPPLTSQDGEIGALAFSPSGAILASGSFDGAVQLWNVATHRPRGDALLGHTDAVLSLAFSPDATILASAGVDHTIRLWDMALDRPSGSPLRGHSDDVWSVVFSPDGTVLASGSADGTVRLWNVAYRRQIGPPLASGNTVTGLAFNRAGTLLAAGSADGPVWLWDMGVTSWIQRACRIANRNLTNQEWRSYLGSAPYQQTCPAAAP